jgi:hypothetical protein
MENISDYLNQASLLERWRLQTIRTKTIDYDESKLQPGDSILVTPAFGLIPGLYHYGVYVGNREVIHVQKQGIVKWDLEKFRENRTKVKIDQLLPLPHEIDNPRLMEKRRELITTTAESMVGEEWKFNALSENCESFTNWVTTGKMHSPQGTVFRNSMFLYGATVFGYVLGRGRIRPWRPSWWKKSKN